MGVLLMMRPRYDLGDTFDRSDTESTLVLKERLHEAKRVCLVGNGGIALELAHRLQSCDVTWVTRTATIGNAFPQYYSMQQSLFDGAEVHDF